MYDCVPFHSIRSLVLLLLIAAAVRPPGADSFNLRVSCIYVPMFFTDKDGIQPTDFLLDSCATHVPARLRKVLFPSFLNHIVMQWQAMEGERVTYDMKFKSWNETISNDPYVDPVLPHGEVDATAPDWQDFTLHFPCKGQPGTVNLEMTITYTIETLDSSQLPGCIPGNLKAIRQGTCSLNAENGTIAPTAEQEGNWNRTDGDERPTFNETYSLSLWMKHLCTGVSSPTATAAAAVAVGTDTSVATIAAASSAGVVALAVLVAAILYVSRQRFRAKAAFAGRNSDSSPGIYFRGMHDDASSTQYTGRSDASRGTLLLSLPEAELADIMTAISAEWAQLLEDCLIEKSNVYVGDEIGRGAFGVVSRGTVRTTCETSGDETTVAVAIKSMKAPNCIEDVSEFLEEALLMKDFRDRNIIKLVGVALQPPSLPLICLEMMENGDLRGYLRRRCKEGEAENSASKQPKVPLGQLVAFCSDIASGMAYLETLKFVHRDLAARNCLLTADLVAKVGDFGLARDIQGGDYYRMGTTRPLPVKWMAPECFDKQVFTSRSDVWAFGVTLWEIFTFGSSPYSFVGNHEMQEFIKAGHRLKAPALMPCELQAVLTACCQYEARQRPDFASILKEVAGLQGQDDYINMHLPPADDTYINVLARATTDDLQLPSDVNAPPPTPTGSTPTTCTLSKDSAVFVTPYKVTRLLQGADSTNPPNGHDHSDSTNPPNCHGHSDGTNPPNGHSHSDYPSYSVLEEADSSGNPLYRNMTPARASGNDME